MDDPNKGLSLVEIAKARYQRAKDYYGPTRQLAIEDTRFVMGDSENRWQWPETVYEDRARLNNKPCLTINVTAQHCNQVINNIRQNRPSAKVVGVDSQADPETAEILGGMLRSIQSYSDADTAHDIAAEHSVYGGEGYWRVLTEYEAEDSFDQVITIKPLTNPQLVFVDPDAVEPDRSDAKWGFIFEDIGKDQAREDHPEADFISWAEDGDKGWVKKDTIRRAEYYWCESKADKLYLLGDGRTARKSDLPDGARVANELLSLPDGQVFPVVDERDTQLKTWYWCKLLGGELEPIDKRVWPGSYLPIITVVGKEINVNGEMIRKGIVRDLKDSARMVNYSYSAAVETLALQNKVPYMASAEAIEGFESIWGSANLENRAYLPFNAFDEAGNVLPAPKREPSATMPTAQVQMLQLSVEQMRASSGQQNANFGIKSEAQSGIGIQRLKAQGEIATFHFPDNLARALKYEAVVILDLIKAKVYSSDRIVRILGLDGKEDKALISHDMPQAYSEAKGNPVEKIFNPLVGRYDIAIDTGPSYQTQRQEAADNLTEISKNNPQIMQVAGDLVMRSYDFPMADEIADRIEKTIPANLRGDDDQQQIPPQVQQAMDQMQQQMQAMSAALETAHEEVTKLEADQQVKQAEVSIKQFDAETKRMALDKNQPQPEAPDNSALIAQQTAIEVAHINAQSAERLKMIEIAGQVMTASTSNEGDDEASAPDESSSALDMTMQALQQMVSTMAAPKRLLRDEAGRAYGVETITTAS